MSDSESILLADRHFHVRCEGEVVAARRTAKEMAQAAGFGTVAAEEIGLAVSELASNIVRHAGSGEIALRTIDQAGAIGIQIEASDQGQGIADLANAFTDGFSTADGLGLGLGAVNRLMDQLDIVSTGTQFRGTRIRCTRWQGGMPSSRPTRRPHSTAVGVISRSRPGETLNGDTWLVTDDGQSCLVAVIDGVGHGEPAHRAATIARHFVETHAREPLDRILTGVAYDCQASRGVVMAMARINWLSGTLEHAGVGNIETRLLVGDTPITLVSRRGILGNGTPPVKINRQSWDPNHILVLFSDGLDSSWEWRQFPSASLLPPQQLARELFNQLACDNDDATVVVVKGHDDRRQRQL